MDRPQLSVAGLQQQGTIRCDAGEDAGCRFAGDAGRNLPANPQGGRGPRRADRLEISSFKGEVELNYFAD